VSTSQHTCTRRPENPLVIEVATGGLAIGRHPERLMTPALGSCVGIALWDPTRRVGALGHVMLPAPGRAVLDPESGRFASWAVPELVRLLVESGSDRSSIQAKIAGGAMMFRSESASVPVGERNVAEVVRQLELAGITLRAEDTGGSHARTVELDLDSGVLHVRSYRFGMRQL
jgi:chemotaxis protein CheD